MLALGEACANAVEHAYVDGAAGEVTVELSMLDDSLVAAVRDFGSWRAVPHDDPDRGRGYEIMRALSDRVDVESGPDGTIVTMHLTHGVDRR